MVSKPVSPKDPVMAWCVGCHDYLDTISVARDVVVVAAQAHMRARPGHPVWLEPAPYSTGRASANRTYNPLSRADEDMSRKADG